jgi:hypothetical protein
MARSRLSRFRKILLAITAGTHLPFVVAMFELSRRLGASWPIALGVGIGLAALGVWLFLGRAEAIAEDRPRPFLPILLLEMPYYVHWAACIYCLVPSIVYLLGSIFFGGPTPGFFLWCYASGLVVCTYGVYVRRWFFITRQVEIAVKGLDPKLDGYRIAHLSDLHIGALTPPWWAKRWIERANAQKPDATVITGDFVTSGVRFHEAIADVVGGLEAKDGVFCSMGNHDYFDGEGLVALIRGKGLKMLRNEGLTLSRGSAKLYLAAIDDTWTRRADIDKALAARPKDEAGRRLPTVMLSHDPDRFPEIVERGVDLVLSGHTHGGQIAWPFLGRWINASKLAHRFHIGLYRDGEASLYVHPGLGTTGPPIRLGVAPAVVMLTLRAV